MSGPAPDLAALNAKLAAGLFLTRYDLVFEASGFQVTLTLADPAADPAADRAGTKLVLVCRDIQNLELLPEGDALSQPMRLQVTDMRGDRLERVSFSLEELDRDTLFLHCAGFAAFAADGWCLDL